MPELTPKQEAFCRAGNSIGRRGRLVVAAPGDPTTPGNRHSFAAVQGQYESGNYGPRYWFVSGAGE